MIDISYLNENTHDGGIVYGKQSNKNLLRSKSECNYTCDTRTFCHEPFSYQQLCRHDDHEIQKSEAEAAASVLARKYSSSTYIDTIICMDGCEIIGAYLADKLTESGIMSLNQHQTMYIVTPEMNPGGQLIFRDNMQMMIRGKHCIILLASATTGRTIARALECVKYYGGIVEGVSAIFSASKEVNGMEINSIFGEKDIPDYRTYEFNKCPLCAKKQKIDAIVNSYGYSKL